MSLSSLFFTSCLLAVSVAFITPSKSNDRIVGGKAVNITDYPYQVALFANGIFVCGGSIISDHLVVTAAHCMMPFINYTIRVGSSSYKSGGEVYEIQRDNILVHEWYNSDFDDFDIALLRVSQSLLREGSDAKMVKLPSENQITKAGVLAKVSGWGHRQQINYPKLNADRDILHAVQVPIVDHSVCTEHYPYGKITDRMICAGYLGIGGRDSCQGDSGGPLVVNGVLIGIVSWGFGCADPQYPGVYTDVAYLREWIKRTGGL